MPKREFPKQAVISPIVLGGFFVIIVLLIVLTLISTRFGTSAGGGSMTITPTAVPSPTPAGTVLKIPQFGIQLVLPSSIKDAYYSVNTVDPDELDFSTHTLAALDPTDCAASDGPAIGAIQVTKEADGYGQLIRLINGVYVYYVSPQAECVQSIPNTAISAAAATAQGQAIAPFKEAALSVEAMQ
jgi:hypothetical protein